MKIRNQTGNDCKKKGVCSQELVSKQRLEVADLSTIH